MKASWEPFALLLGCAYVAHGCAHDALRARTAPGQLATARSAKPPAASELIALAELPREQTTEGLSGTWFDASTRTLFALQDTVPQIVPIAPSNDFRSWTPGPPIALVGRPDASWDGEALSHVHGELLVIADESAARIERFALTGQYLGAIALPARLARQVRDNKGIEGLTVSPSERFLFAATEGALRDDGPLATHAQGTTVRILRRELASGRDEQCAYRSEPLGGGGDGEMGVSDLAAVSDDVLLVLERGYQAGYGNTVRIFRVDFRARSAAGALDASTPLLAKTLVVDLAALPAGGIPQGAPQPSPLLENYEALSLGPIQPDGRRLLFVTSDDNTRREQRARILVLSVTVD